MTMKKLSLILTTVLFGCSLQQAPLSDNTKTDTTSQTPLAKYQECMGYSDKTIIHSSERPGRYIVLASEKSINQPWANKKEQGQIYYTSLLECPTGDSIEQCTDQQRLIIRNIGTKDKWQVGSIKKFINADFMFDKTIRAEWLRDGRFVDITNYCYIDRNNITKSYCGHFVHTSSWHSECKDKLVDLSDSK